MMEKILFEQKVCDLKATASLYHECHQVNTQFIRCVFSNQCNLSELNLNIFMNDLSESLDLNCDPRLQLDETLQISFIYSSLRV